MAFSIFSLFLIVIILTISVCVFLALQLAVANIAYGIRSDKNLLNLKENEELVLVHVLHRHGDRNPVGPAPGGLYNDLSYWPEGWGQLTTLGVQQEFALGEFLRRRYSTFLSHIYNVKDIYVQSSDFDRTLMSTQSVLAGLYPPIGTKIWNKNVLWQPIPVHTMPISTDHLIAGGVPNCPQYEIAKLQYMASDEMNEFENSAQRFYDYLTLKTKALIDDFNVVTRIRDSWTCESAHNYTLPEWSKGLYPNNKDFEQTAMKKFYLPTATKLMAKFMSGFLVKDILDRFKSKIENTLSPDRKLWMYSTHDSTLFSLLDSLDIFDDNPVPYAAAIIIELRKFENKHYVQIFYRNSDKMPDPLPIPGCGLNCPLSKMYEIYDSILPKYDFETECQIPV